MSLSRAPSELLPLIEARDGGVRENTFSIELKARIYIYENDDFNPQTNKKDAVQSHIDKHTTTHPQQPVDVWWFYINYVYIFIP